MPSENTSSRKLAAILFADVAGYTALMQKDESAASTWLKRFQNDMNKLVIAHNGQIVNFYGDGALCTFHNPLEAMRCAIELQSGFQDDPVIPVRIGIHSGTVVTEGDKVYGDSVNIASRIESMGIPGAILVSKKVRDELKNQPDILLPSLGSFEFKNVEEPMEVFALANEGFAVPKREEIVGKFKSKKRPNWQIPAIVGALLLAAFVYWISNNSNQSSSKSSNPSIAVLPFDDMSPAKDQEYFADGIAEEILNTLAQLNELKVAGRTSSFSFKNKESTIGEIGELLKVNHVLEGSIRKHEDKIRITAQLIKVADGFHMWSDTYDRDFKDVFKIQDEVAQSIGQILLEKLAPEQIVKLKSKNVINSEAYELFLKAKHIHDNEYLGGGYPISQFKLCESLYQEALSFDQNYAMAHAGLAELYDTHYYRKQRENDSLSMKHYKKLMREESDLAYDLDPDNYFVNAVKGWVSVSYGDNKTAYNCFLRSIELNPGSPEGILGLGRLYQEVGLLEDAIKLYDRVLELDPFRKVTYSYIANCLTGVNNLERAMEMLNRRLDIDPSHIGSKRHKAYIYVLLNQHPKALEVYTEIVNNDPTLSGLNTFHKAIYLFLRGDIEDATKVYRDSQSPFSAWMFGDLDECEKRLKTSWSSTNTFILEQNRYLSLMNSVFFDVFKSEPWFNEKLNVEKEYYEKYYSEFKRAEEIIN